MSCSDGYFIPPDLFQVWRDFLCVGLITPVSYTHLLGTPYVQENCDIAESDNLVIYGHHIKGGKMFGALEDYKMPISNKIYPRTGDTQTVYLKNVITNPNIKIGDYTMYNLSLIHI